MAPSCGAHAAVVAVCLVTARSSGAQPAALAVLPPAATLRLGPPSLAECRTESARGATPGGLSPALRNTGARRSPTSALLGGSGSSAVRLAPSASECAPQLVFLDFDSGVPAFEVVLEQVPGFAVSLGTLPSHVYTPAERDRIEAAINEDFEPFGVIATQTRPAGQAFSTLIFNADFPVALIPLADGSFFIDAAFGEAEGVDVRNRIIADRAVIAAHLWELLASVDGTGAALAAQSGLPLDPSQPLAALVSEAVVRQSANTAAHELGHLLGLRHHDGLGAPGRGLPASGPPGRDAFVPSYDGPELGDEATLHLMSTGITGVGSSERARLDQFHGERSALKLALPCNLTPLSELDARGPNPLEPVAFDVPNSVVAGENAGRLLTAEALLVSGTITAPSEVDSYRVSGRAGTSLTIEVMSTTDSNELTPLITNLALFVERGAGRELVAANAQSFEPFDPLILDAELPADGTYVLEVSAADVVFVDASGDGVADTAVSLARGGFAGLDRGDYELLAYAIRTSPTGQRGIMP